MKNWLKNLLVDQWLEFDKEVLLIEVCMYHASTDGSVEH